MTTLQEYQIEFMKSNNGFGYVESEEQLLVKTNFERFISMLDKYNLKYINKNICYSNGVSCYVEVCVDGYKSINYRMSDHRNGTKWNDYQSNIYDVDSVISFLGWLAKLDGFFEYQYLDHFEEKVFTELGSEIFIKNHLGSKILSGFVARSGRKMVRIEQPIYSTAYLNIN